MTQITEVREHNNLENELIGTADNFDTTHVSSSKKTNFQLECERGVSIEEARQHTHEFIKQLWKK